MNEREQTDIARATDPATSHEAAEHMIESGQRETIGDRIAAALVECPGLTYGQVADRLDGLDRAQVWRRLSDLHSAGRAFPHGEAVYEGTGRTQRRWWPTGHHEPPAGAVREPTGRSELPDPPIYIDAISKVDPQPGDLLVVEVVRAYLTDEQAQAIAEQVGRHANGARVVVVERGTKITLHREAGYLDVQRGLL